MANKYLLTTLDNPFNPFIDYDSWYAYDVSHGYNTCAYLARIAKVSDDLGEEDEDKEIANAMDEIVKFNLLGNYIKVTEDYVPRNVQVEV
jgi:hypothetical protein